MIHIHTRSANHFERVARCPSCAVKFANLVDDHWAICHPDIGVGFSPIVTFQGSEQEAREALTPIIQALQRGAAEEALQRAIVAERILMPASV